jgi:hypothetical protein
MTGVDVVLGVLLVAPMAFTAVEAVGHHRGHFNTAFWRLSLDAKLAHISRHMDAWWLVSLAWLPYVTLSTAGLAGLAFLLADPVGWAAMGAFALGGSAWLVGIAIQAGAIGTAARLRADSGTTPQWTAALWDVGFVLEAAWIVLANVAAVGFGLAIVRTSILPGWVGWLSLGVGLAIPIGVLVTRNGFPHLALPIPVALGVALLLT